MSCTIRKSIQGTLYSVARKLFKHVSITKKRYHIEWLITCRVEAKYWRLNFIFQVMAIVTSTGFLTAKGSLVSAIMYPPPVDFRFERDSYRFIGFLASLASIGFTYSIVKKVISSRYFTHTTHVSPCLMIQAPCLAVALFQQIISGEAGVKVVFHSFDIITICVPPALPAAMTAGIILAQKRLELRHIYCISPRSINVSGWIVWRKFKQASY